MRTHRVRAAGAGLVLSCLGAFVPAVASGPAPPRSNYIVTFRADPIGRLDPSSEEGAGRRRRLDMIEGRVRQAVGISVRNMGYRYRTTLAGFSARLTGDQVERLRRHSDVAAVTPDRLRVARNLRPGDAPVSTGAGPAAVPAAVSAAPAAPPAGVAPQAENDLAGQPADVLGLADGLWARLGGPDHAGEDVIVGVIDGGIYPEHPSFADQPIAADGSRNYMGPAYGPPPARWHGTCQAGEAWPVTTCNNKLIGARYFVDGWGVDNVAAEDFLSPRDIDGHGTGMASIAAGNYGVAPSYQGRDLGLGLLSGIAPRARIAHYKALWAIPAFGGAGFGSDSDLAAAIDAAVADGVDVISMSIGGELGATRPLTDQSTMLDATSQALLRAFEAGVPAVLAAGNSGPDPRTVETPSHTPWVISAGNSRMPVTFAATATITGGSGAAPLVVEGASPNPGLGAVPLIDAASAAAPGAAIGDAAACEPGALDPALVAGKAVLCEPFADYAAAAGVYQAGGAGVILYQPDQRPAVDDFPLPTIAVTPADAAAIRRRLSSSPGPTVTITPGTLAPSGTGDVVYARSARGPAIRSESILKPDLVAPGTDMLVAHTLDVPPGARELFDYSLPGLFRPLKGTSLSVATTSGSAALLLALHPGLDPSEVKSALMTTAQPDVALDTDGAPSIPATPLDIGAGRIDPNRAASPGLVVRETTQRFRDYVAGQIPDRDPAGPVPDASDLNLPAVAFDPLVGPRSTGRTFTSVDDRAGTWSAAFEGLNGVSATATPARFTVEPGQSATVEFTFTPAAPDLGEHVSGAVVLTNAEDGRTVRLPVVVRLQRFEVPEQANFGVAEAAGHAPLAVPTGYAGSLSVQGYGLARPEVRREQMVGMDDITEDLNRIAQPGPGVATFDLVVPPGADALAAEIGGAVLADQFADLDLYVFHDADRNGFRADDLVDESLTGAVRESVLLRRPAPGAYRISVRGFTVAGTATFDLTTWVLAEPTPDITSDPPGPGLAVNGDPVVTTTGGTVALDLEWTGLDEPGVYLGLITFHDTADPTQSRPLREMVVAITRR